MSRCPVSKEAAWFDGDTKESTTRLCSLHPRTPSTCSLLSRAVRTYWSSGIHRYLTLCAGLALSYCAKRATGSASSPSPRITRRCACTRSWLETTTATHPSALSFPRKHVLPSDPPSPPNRLCLRWRTTTNPDSRLPVPAPGSWWLANHRFI